MGTETQMGTGTRPGMPAGEGKAAARWTLGAMREAMRASMRAAAAASGFGDANDFEGLGGDNDEPLDVPGDGTWLDTENSDSTENTDTENPVAAARLELASVLAALDRGRRDSAFVAAAPAALRDETAECSVCFERRHVGRRSRCFAARTRVRRRASRG